MYQAFLDQYKKDLTDAILGIDAVEFEKTIGLLSDAYQGGKQVFIMGNGGSAGTANHFVCDFGKNAVQDPAKPRFRIISLCDNVEKITAFGNDVSFDEIFRQQLINLLNPGDVLIAISASGNSPDLVRACEYAKEKDVRMVTLSGFRGGKIKEYADAAFVVPLESYEMIEDVHLNIMHMIVYFFKNHPEALA
ncbi:MAG: SIS domain-containing protein [Clostridia bacterium]|nr:SIS domain-containing protein [Clostridia bacterium]